MNVEKEGQVADKDGLHVFPVIILVRHQGFDE